MNTLENPLVSIIVPNFNYARYLVSRLNSIGSQSYGSVEIIILDDASTDNSIDVIKKIMPGHSRLICSAVNSGSPFLQWQKGIGIARGKYVWIAEADDISDPLFLASMIPVLEADEEVGMVYSQSIAIDSSGRVISSLRSWTDDLSTRQWLTGFTMNGTDFIRSFLIYKCVIPNVSAVVFRRSFLNDSLFPPASLKSYGDWVFYSNLLRSSSIAFVPLDLNFFRQHDSNQRFRPSTRRLYEYSTALYLIGISSSRLLDSNDCCKIVSYHKMTMARMVNINSLAGKMQGRLDVVRGLTPFYLRIFCCRLKHQARLILFGIKDRVYAFFSE